MQQYFAHQGTADAWGISKQAAREIAVVRGK